MLANFICKRLLMGQRTTVLSLKIYKRSVLHYVLYWKAELCQITAKPRQCKSNCCWTGTGACGATFDILLPEGFSKSRMTSCECRKPAHKSLGKQKQQGLTPYNAFIQLDRAYKVVLTHHFILSSLRMVYYFMLSINWGREYSSSGLWQLPNKVEKSKCIPGIW